MNIFCYGSLMWQDLWDHCVQNEYPAKEAHLKGYRCRKVKGSFEPALIHSPLEDNESDIVPGIVYLDVNQGDLDRVANYYSKEYEILEGACFTTENNVALSAKFFLWRSEYRSLLSTEDWTKEWFEEKALNDFRRAINQSLF